MRLFAYTGIIITVLIFASACSKGDSPTSPSGTQKTQTAEMKPSSDNHHLWHYSLVSYDPATNQLEAIPMRDVADHWNVTKWLEQGPCTNCFTIKSATKQINNNLLVGVQIKHPFPSLNLTGFDVRGIVMFKGSQTFPAAGLKTSSTLKGEGELVNAAGFTTLYNPTTTGDGPGGLQGYVKGKLAAGLPDSTLNGFVRYVSPDADNARSYFKAGTSITSNFEIHLPGGPLIFGYAIDASWMPADVKPVQDPNTDFPANANCSEPYRIQITEDSDQNTLTNLGGKAVLNFKVWDHQYMDSYKTPTVECPGLFDGTQPATFVDSVNDFDNWTVEMNNTKLAGAGSYKALVAVEDKANDTSPEWLNLTTYQIATVMVAPETALHGWAVTFGGNDWDQAMSSTADSSGNVYVTGSFFGDCNFNPKGSAVKTSNGGRDAFLAKYDASGNFVWVNTWGGSNWEMGVDVALDGDNVLSYGYYEGTVDFSGGSGTDVRKSNGNMDYFLLAFNASSGAHKWTDTWGSSNYDYANGLGVDSIGNIYLGGTFGQPCDFDPGSGKHEVDPIGYDAFLLKLASNGTFLWVQTWGTSTGQDMEVTNIATSQSGDTWMCGYFQDSGDFDPGPGVDNHTSNGALDCWVSRFDPNGKFKWARTWGTDSDDLAMGVKPDAVGNCYITGEFRGTVDFDPGAGVHEYTSTGNIDGFLLELDSSGNYAWCGTVGGPNDDKGKGVTIDSLGNILLTGEFSGNANVSPCSTTSFRDSNGSSDIFLTKITAAHEFLWADAWGGSAQERQTLPNWVEYGNPVSVDMYGKVYVVGSFGDVVNFNPNNGAPADNHTANDFDAFITTIPASGNW